MLVLAIDTTEDVATVALTKDDKCLEEYRVKSNNTHSEIILPMIDDLLKKHSYTVKDVDLMACAIGPGSFTGLRIGCATIKGLALPYETPCVGVSSLLALAKQLSCFKGTICSVINARRGQFYTAIYKSNGDGKLKAVEDEKIMLVDEIRQRLANEKNVYLTGSGCDMLKDEIPCCVTPENMKYESAYSVAVCALEKYQKARNKKDFTAEKLNPIYLRKSQAEMELEEKMKGEK